MGENTLKEFAVVQYECLVIKSLGKKRKKPKYRKYLESSKTTTVGYSENFNDFMNELISNDRWLAYGCLMTITEEGKMKLFKMDNTDRSVEVVFYYKTIDE